MMTIVEASNLPLFSSVDVLICGGGTAGAVAAIAAARRGCTTLIVEQLSSLGGTQTQSWVTPMMPNKILEESLTHGISEEILQRSAKYDPPPSSQSGDLLWFNPTTLALVLDRLTHEAGASVLFNTLVSDVILTGDTIVGVVIENKAGRQRIDAKIVIDCTGDADIAFRSGAPCQSDGDENSEHTGRRQPVSLRFNMAHVNFGNAASHLVDELGMPCYSRKPLFEIWAGDASESELGPLITKAIDDQILEKNDLGYLQFFSMLGRPGELAFNCPRIEGIDPNDPQSCSDALRIGREKIQRISRFFRKYVDGFEDAYVSVVAPMLGIRESRRIIGEYVLTEDDYFNQARFPDAIASNSYPIDIHTPDGTVLKHLPKGAYHEIPYRCLVPLKIDNLLVAGRCVSATFTAQAAIRIQQNCRAMGEAAGIAASLCVKGLITPRELNGAKVRAAVCLDQLITNEDSIRTLI